MATYILPFWPIQQWQLEATLEVTNFVATQNVGLGACLFGIRLPPFTVHDKMGTPCFR
jgi:hypothetical protein